MKTNSNSLFTPISSSTLKAITMEVKETLATSLSNTNGKSFRSIDLWNIRRKSRFAVVRRNFL